MRLTTLGCHGGELPGCRSTCFLVDTAQVLDAGALTSTLSLDALARVDDILLTHSHFDHVKDLPLLTDLLVGVRKKPVTVHASTSCIAALKKSMFNDVLWPDFTTIPSKKHPVLKLKSFKPGSSFRIGKYSVKSVIVDHPVESCGFVISDGKVSLGMSGDTGPTDKLWKLLNKVDNLKALLVETSFPNAHQDLADLSGHLTPRTLETELLKFNKARGCEVFLYHLKPAYVDQLKREVAHLPVSVLELGDIFEL